MKIIKGIKIGGLQQKIFNLVLFFVLAIIGANLGMSIYEQKTLTEVVQDTAEQQQAAITQVSEQTMEGVLNATMLQTTALQAYIADDLFNDVKNDVLTLKAFAEGLFTNAESFSAYAVAPPNAAEDGTVVAQLISEPRRDPSGSEIVRVVSNMTEIMLARYSSSEKISSLFVGTADGHMILVNDRPSTFVAPDGSPLTLGIRQRPWYTQAAEAGELIFTGVEVDAYTDVPMLECAVPVYHDGRLVAVIGADIWLTTVSEYVESKASEGSFICVVGADGKMLFSPVKEGVFKVEYASKAADLRQNENKELAEFITAALEQNTALTQLEIEGKEYYVCGVPLDTLGWTVLSVVDKEVTRQPTNALLESYDAISESASAGYEEGMLRVTNYIVLVTVLILLLAALAALALATRIVKPIENMTRQINALGGSDRVFQMDESFRTGDEIEIMAESFATLTTRAQEYVAQITRVTAEKERIGAELNVATQIQADMLPRIFPAFPDRTEFDLYASMCPAKEVGGDFYDFFLVDDDHLCLVMADVSGKGVPAALFMVIAKTLIKNRAQLGESPAEILQHVNEQLCEGNEAELFVTVWLAIMEISTGKGLAANAGHEHPVIRRADGSYELAVYRHSPAVATLPGIRFREHAFELHAGDGLFVYTDGVPEATNAHNELFGTERMLSILNADPNADPNTLLTAMKSGIDEFVGDAPQFDDITMLSLIYRGAQGEQPRDEKAV